jgi:8-oxo-dGTP pyrophosphatase MutT (NUDIX family)
MSEFVASFGHPFADDTREKVGVIVYDNAGHVLLVQGMTGKISLPKGGRLRGETELEGAVREAWEETGIDLEKTTYILKTKLIWGTYFVYKLNVRAKELVLRPQAGETTAVLWKSPTSFWLNHSDRMNCDLKFLIKDLGRQVNYKKLLS